MNSNSLQYEEYITIQKTFKGVLSTYPSSHAYFDFTRAPLARSAYEKWCNGKKISPAEEKAYLVKALSPKMGEELTKNEFEKLAREYGAGVVKIALIDRNLTYWIENSKPNEKILIAGGACVLESRDTKFIQYLSTLKEGKEYVRQYVEKLFVRYPTWTQITGALIPSAPISVFYDETFPWHLRISEYGIKNAQLETQRVYDEIYQAVCRFAGLYDPKNIVMRIPFIALDLAEKQHLRSWMESANHYLRENKVKYNLENAKNAEGQFMKAWIEYTYAGPNILEINKSIIKEKYPDIFSSNDLENYTIHVRSKQIDHLDTERMNSWTHSVILDMNESRLLKDRKESLFTTYQQRTIAMYEWMRDEIQNTPSIGFAGFMDQTCRGRILHEDSIRAKSALRKGIKKMHFDNYFSSPFRLHKGNVADSIQFLSRFKNPNVISFSKEILIELSDSKRMLEKNTKKNIIITQIIEACEFFSRVFSNEVEGTVYDEKKTIYKNQLTNFKSKIIERFVRDIKLRRFIESEYPVEHDVRSLIQDIVESSVSIESSGKDESIKVQLNPKYRKLAAYFRLLIQKEIQVYTDQKMALEESIHGLNSRMKAIYASLSSNIIEHQNDHLTEYVDILPLADNLFFSYVQQLIFIPSLKDAYLEMVQIESSPTLEQRSKETCIMEIIQQIFPIVESCIHYVMLGGEYPWEARFESRYKRIINAKSL
ncbi:hypothetical protein KBD81_02105 [Candidatus Woesebacteria bacterium]|nr:hypothetical protein [Candidatus Woesebacteria bacterium]